MQKIALPGDYLGSSENILLNNSVYIENGKVFTRKIGKIKEINQNGVDKLYLEEFNNQDNKLAHFNCIKIGSLVVCRAKSFTDSKCKVDIIGVGGKPLSATYRGIIHIEDIRLSFHRDFVKAYHSFCRKDIILARVIGVLDTRSNFESCIFRVATNEQELGVILARSPGDANSFLMPVSWCEMMCPTTGIKYKRKVAKVIVRDD